MVLCPAQLSSQRGSGAVARSAETPGARCITAAAGHSLFLAHDRCPVVGTGELSAAKRRAKPPRAPPPTYVAGRGFNTTSITEY